MQTDKKYKIFNWPEYNKSLIQRGSINIWIDEDAIKKWRNTSHTGKAGRPQIYSDEAILMMLIIREVFHLPLRALQGFVQSVFKFMNIDLPVPSYTQVSRRAEKLHKKVKRLLKGKNNCDIIFDSTGLKVRGEGEWKIKVHGKSKRRTWRKFHIGIDAETQDIICCELTDNATGDAEMAEEMLNKLPIKVRSVSGDGHYDASRVRKKVHEKGGKCKIPPPIDAVYKEGTESWEKERDDAVLIIKGLGGGEDGRDLWKKLSGYHKRSLVETSMFRIKTLFGGNLKARSMGAQITESLCKALSLNKMNKLGLPTSKMIFSSA